MHIDAEFALRDTGRRGSKTTVFMTLQMTIFLLLLLLLMLFFFVLYQQEKSEIGKGYRRLSLPFH